MEDCDRQGCMRTTDPVIVPGIEGPQRGETRILADGCKINICGVHKLWPEDFPLPGVYFHPNDTHIVWR